MPRKKKYMLSYVPSDVSGGRLIVNDKGKAGVGRELFERAVKRAERYDGLIVYYKGKVPMEITVPPCGIERFRLDVCGKLGLPFPDEEMLRRCRC